MIFCVVCCNTKPTMSQEKFSIDIWDYRASLSVTLHYHIDNDSVIVEKEGGVQDDETQRLISKRLNNAETQRIIEGLSSLPITKLEDKYIDPLTEDGDQKTIELIFGEVKKEIEISNVYVEDLAILITLVNDLLDPESRITYSK